MWEIIGKLDSSEESCGLKDWDQNAGKQSLLNQLTFSLR